MFSETQNEARVLFSSWVIHIRDKKDDESTKEKEKYR